MLDSDRRRDKTDDIAVLVGQGVAWGVIEAEIAKCGVVCANCHRRCMHQRREIQRRVKKLVWAAWGSNPEPRA